MVREGTIFENIEVTSLLLINLVKHWFRQKYIETVKYFPQSFKDLALELLPEIKIYNLTDPRFYQSSEQER